MFSAFQPFSISAFSAFQLSAFQLFSISAFVSIHLTVRFITGNDIKNADVTMPQLRQISGRFQTSHNCSIISRGANNHAVIPSAGSAVLVFAAGPNRD
ncbi:MAG: hypothetical protein U1G07_20210 [Verrucomicrobiota bacterium]